MSYQELLSQAVVKGLGVTLGVVLGLVTVTPALKYFYTETPRKQSDQKKQVSNKTQESTQSNQMSQTNPEAFNETMYKTLFDDLQTSSTTTRYY